MAAVDDDAYESGAVWESASLVTSLDALVNKKADVKISQRFRLRERVASKQELQMLSGCPAGGEVTVKVGSAKKIQQSVT